MAAAVAAPATLVVVTVVVSAALVVPGITLPGKLVVVVSPTLSVLVTVLPLITIVAVVGSVTVSSVRPPETVDGLTVVPGIVSVYVNVTGLPRLETGIAEPTPVPVNWVGMGRVAVFGFAASLDE